MIVYSPLSLKASLSGLALRNYGFFISQPPTLLSPTAWPPARHRGPFSLRSSELGPLLPSSLASSCLQKSPQNALIILSSSLVGVGVAMGVTLPVAVSPHYDEIRVRF